VRTKPDHQKPATCLSCGGDMVPIAYGYPGVEMWEAEQRGEIVLGGCCLDPGLPTEVCRECGQMQTWGRISP
jgi:hypothetical protein